MEGTNLGYLSIYFEVISDSLTKLVESQPEYQVFFLFLGSFSLNDSILFFNFFNLKRHN